MHHLVSFPCSRGLHAHGMVPCMGLYVGILCIAAMQVDPFKCIAPALPVHWLSSSYCCQCPRGPILPLSRPQQLPGKGRGLSVVGCVGACSVYSRFPDPTRLQGECPGPNLSPQ